MEADFLWAELNSLFSNNDNDEIVSTAPIRLSVDDECLLEIRSSLPGAVTITALRSIDEFPSEPTLDYMARFCTPRVFDLVGAVGFDCESGLLSIEHHVDLWGLQCEDVLNSLGKISSFAKSSHLLLGGPDDQIAVSRHLKSAYAAIQTKDQTEEIDRLISRLREEGIQFEKLSSRDLFLQLGEFCALITFRYAHPTLFVSLSKQTERVDPRRIVEFNTTASEREIGALCLGKSGALTSISSIWKDATGRPAYEPAFATSISNLVRINEAPPPPEKFVFPHNFA